MEDKQLSFIESISSEKKTKAEKQMFLMAFQKWSDKMADDQFTANGKCGYGDCCDFCSSSAEPNPCAKAMRIMIRVEKIEMDYSRRDFENIW